VVEIFKSPSPPLEKGELIFYEEIIYKNYYIYPAALRVGYLFSSFFMDGRYGIEAY